MKKNLLLLVFSLLVMIPLNAQIVITEIMYNPPGNDDNYEYLELYNSGSDTVQMENYKFTEGIEYTFQDYKLAPNTYLLLAKDSTVITEWGVQALIWDNGGLKNSGEDIVLVNGDSVLVDIVDFDDGGDWPSEPDGDGPSLELCDVTKDNSKVEFWKASNNFFITSAEGKDVYGTPGTENSVSCVTLPEPDFIVSASGTSFTPSEITIQIGDIVQWNNDGGLHNVNGSLAVFPNNPEGFYSGEPSSDEWVFQHQFLIPGTYNYQCDQHAGLGMTGIITVLDKPKPKLVINEIMYNDGGTADSLEFIEILNASPDTVLLANYNLKSRFINYTFDNYYLFPKRMIVIAKYPEVFNKYFGFYPKNWGQGGLNNKTDTLQLFDDDNELIDMVIYQENGNWSELADGQGYSLSLCDAASDNSIGTNWQASPVYAGFQYLDKEIHANPGAKNYCSYETPFLKQIDSLGAIVNKNTKSFSKGVVHGINYNSNGLQFVLMDNQTQGIWIYSHNNDFNYSFHEGDKVELWGNLEQFKGLIQIKLDSIVLIETAYVLSQPTETNILDESTEGQLVKISDVKLLDYTEWTNSGSGFNVKVANATDTFSIRIDKDTDLYGKPHPVGTFSVTGLGGQYDSHSPYLDGYQLLPRYVADISPFNNNLSYPLKTIEEVTQINDDGVGESKGEKCELRGVVYGVNLKPSGLQFTLIDAANDGIGVYSKSDNLGYTVKQGDYISLKGTISQYNGLLQINPDTLNFVNSDSDLHEATLVTELNEDTESQLIKIENLTIKDISKWKGDGSAFNVTVTNGTEEFTMRIDNDVDLSTKAAPNYTFNLTGIGGQYDSSSPYLSGYQILPRYSEDIEKVNATHELNYINIDFYPNPANNKLFIDANTSKINSVIIFNMKGQKVLFTSDSNIINIGKLKNGTYKALILTSNGIVSKTFIKQ